VSDWYMPAAMACGCIFISFVLWDVGSDSSRLMRIVLRTYAAFQGTFAATFLAGLAVKALLP